MDNVVKKRIDGFGICKGAKSFEEEEDKHEEFVDGFFNVPKLKKKLSTRDIKKIIYEQYDEKLRRCHIL